MGLPYCLHLDGIADYSRLYIAQSRTSSEIYLLQFTKFLGVIHIRGSSFLIGGSDYNNYALQQESCHYLSLPKFWVVLTKDNSSVTPYQVCCTLTGTRILEVLGLFLLYPWTPDSSVFPFKKLNLGRFFPVHFTLEESHLAHMYLALPSCIQRTLDNRVPTFHWVLAHSLLLSDNLFPYLCM